MTKQKKEHLLAYCLMLFIISLCNLAYIHWQATEIKMNGLKFTAAGMMEYHDPTNGNTVYMPVYSKRN